MKRTMTAWFCEGWGLTDKKYTEVHLTNVFKSKLNEQKSMQSVTMPETNQMHIDIRQCCRESFEQNLYLTYTVRLVSKWNLSLCLKIKEIRMYKKLQWKRRRREEKNTLEPTNLQNSAWVYTTCLGNQNLILSLWHAPRLE